MVERTRRLSMLISDEEWSMLASLAEKEGLSVSDYVRQFTRRTYASTFGDKKPPRPKK